MPERMTVNHDVTGSSPAGGANKAGWRAVLARQFCFMYGPLAQLVRATGS